MTRMKMILISSLLLCSQMLFSQIKVDELFAKYSKETEVTNIKLGRFALGLVNLFTDTKGVKRVEIVDLSDCDKLVVEDYKANLSSLDKRGYEPFISQNEKGNKTRVFLKMKEEAICELLVFMAGDDGNFMLRLKGKIKFSDINNLMQQYAN